MVGIRVVILVGTLAGIKVVILVGRRRCGQSTPEMHRLPKIALLVGQCNLKLGATV